MSSLTGGNKSQNNLRYYDLLQSGEGPGTDGLLGGILVDSLVVIFKYVKYLL